MKAKGMAVGQAIEAATRRFSAAGIDTPRLDARLLVAHTLGLVPAGLFSASDRSLSGEEADRLATMVERRLRHEPVARIVGSRGFWTFEVEISPETLEPRPDTETVVEAVLAVIPDRDRPVSILDLGTGSGVLLLALLSEYRNGVGLGIDISPQAVMVAARNAYGTGLADRARFQEGNWFSGIHQRFDIIVSNPPYVPTGDIGNLAPEVRDYDPYCALDGGEDGLEAYRVLCGGAAAYLVSGGLIALEVGIGQACAVLALLLGAGFRDPGVRCDLGGIERCVFATWDGLDTVESKKRVGGD